MREDNVPMIAEAPAPTGAASLFVTFRVGRQSYALPLHAVLQVVRLPALTVVPGAPPAVCGLLNLRGGFVPVLDGRALLDEALQVGLESQIIVIGTGADSAPAVSLLVDEVSMVHRFASARFAALAGNDAIVVGVLHAGDEAIIVMDPEALAARAMRA